MGKSSARTGRAKLVRRAALLSFSCLASALPLYQDCQAAPTYTRRLVPATFNSYSSGGGGVGGSRLQQVNGVHLGGGETRTPGSKAQVYQPGEPTLNHALVRWEAKKMPLKIWISPGLQLPDASLNDLPAIRPNQVFDMLRQPGTPFADLPVAKLWTEETNFQVASGIEQWRQFEKEGLFSFGFTDDPRQAHILVFFVDNFKDATAPGGVSTGGVTCAQLFTTAQSETGFAQKPVIIEMSTMVNQDPEKMIGATAHEFGHALGIKEHSPYRDDIMYINRVVNSLSEADKATIRALYRSRPAYVM